MYPSCFCCEGHPCRAIEDPKGGKTAWVWKGCSLGWNRVSGMYNMVLDRVQSRLLIHMIWDSGENTPTWCWDGSLLQINPSLYTRTEVAAFALVHSFAKRQ